MIRETIDSLIAKLEKAKKEHGGKVDVWLDHGDGAYEALDQKDAHMLVIPSSNIYLEEKMFIIKVGEDSLG